MAALDPARGPWATSVPGCWLGLATEETRDRGMPYAHRSSVDPCHSPMRHPCRAPAATERNAEDIRAQNRRGPAARQVDRRNYAQVRDPRDRGPHGRRSQRQSGTPSGLKASPDRRIAATTLIQPQGKGPPVPVRSGPGCSGTFARSSCGTRSRTRSSRPT